jgi:hypothetical protein
VPKPPIPPVVLVYGLLGLIPFLLPPIAGFAVPAHAADVGLVALGYGALILSFLGGARWGLEVARPAPRFTVISLAMLPTLAALAVLLIPGLARPVQLTAMAVLLAIHLAWDARAAGLPPWYPRLRALLSVGAVICLVAMALAIRLAERGEAALFI